MIREYTSEDFEHIKRMNPNPAYEFPDLMHPLMLVRKCVIDEEGKPRLAAFGRLHINALLFVDHAWKTPADRLAALMELQTAMMDDARAKGLDIATTQVEGRFAERLAQLGWIRGFGDIYYHDI